MATTSEGLESGLEHHRAGRFAEAERIYRAVLDRDPDNAEAHHLRGVLSYDRGQAEDAISRFESAVAMAPEIAKYHANLGSVYAAVGRFDEALPTLERAVALDPDAAATHNSLGAVHREHGRLDDSIAAYRRAIEIDGSFAQAHGNLAVALLFAGRRDEALESAEAAVAADPDDAECHNTLGSVLAAHRRGDEAMGRFERAVELAPDFAEARRNLGLALLKACRYEQSASHFAQVVAQRPDDGAGHAGLARALRLQGRHHEALPHFRRSVELVPDNFRYHSNLLFNMIASPELDRRAILDEHREWNRRFARPLATAGTPHANKRDPERRLRIGYVSPDFHGHPVGRLSVPVLAAHDRDAVEVFCYSRVGRPDEITERLRAAVAFFRETAHESDAAVAELVRADGIDILVDLAGHTARHRLRTFARKPAPVQATWLGYLGTTGLDAIDYLIGDPVHTPDGCEADFSERIKRMPHCLVCAEAPTEAPDIGPPPVAANGHMTFGVFNNPSKMTAPVIALWSRILEAVPDSRLLMKFRGLEDAGVRAYLRARFADCGIDAERLELRGTSPYREVLTTYHEVDLALDTTPYSGTATTLESLWMGVPVVALRGERMVSRASAAILGAAGLGELAAGDADGYVALAVALAGDGERLEALRAGMRDRLRASPLYDVAGFTRDLEALYRGMWREWCAG